MATANNKTKTSSEMVRRDWSDAEIAKLTDRAQHGDKTAMRELREAFKIYPDLLEQSEDLALQTRLAMLGQSNGGRDEFLKAVWIPKLEKMERELLPTDREATPLERMLIERVATCYLDAHMCDMVAAGQRDCTLAQAAYHDKRRDRAHHRYVSACLALARARRLLAPVAQQVNIAQPGAQQVNMAAPGVARRNVPPAPIVDSDD